MDLRQPVALGSSRMTAAWPEAVNTDIMRQGYSEQDVDEREEFQPEKGEPITWLSPSVEGTRYQVTIRCTTTEKLILKEFYRDRLGNGVLRFTRPDPATREDRRVHLPLARSSGARSR